MRKFEEPLEVKKGVSQSKFFRLLAGTPPNQTPVNMSTAEFRTDLKYKIGDAVITTLTSTNGGFNLSDPEFIEMVLNDATLDLVVVDTTKDILFPFTDVVFDIEYRYNGSGPWYPFLMGVLRVIEEGTTSN